MSAQKAMWTSMVLVNVFMVLFFISATAGLNTVSYVSLGLEWVFVVLTFLFAIQWVRGIR